jgi:hypothetical protein
MSSALERRDPNSLAARHPALAREWCGEKNGALRPEEVPPNSGRIVWWRCPASPPHTWQAAVRIRVQRGYGCPTCRRRAASLAALYPDLAAQWDHERNGTLRPEDVAAKANRKVWWRCPRVPTHSWYALVASRTLKQSGCPICAGELVIPETSLATLRPELAAEWHSRKNGALRPSQVTPGSDKKVWWRCAREPSHEWRATVRNRVNGTHCPHCAGRVVTPVNSLAALHPDLLAEWHPTRNGALRPEELLPGSHRRVWWRCRRDKRHAWQAVVNKRTHLGRGCPFCVGRRATPENSLAAAYPELVSEWHPTRNGALLPTAITRGSGRKVWWRCARDPAHEWQARVNHRSISGVGCPRCRARRREERQLLEICAALKRRMTSPRSS